MRILSLRKEEMEIFRWMDPANLLERLELPHYFALTGVLDDPVALLIASVKRTELAIEWVFVAPGYRRQGIATKLIHYVKLRTKGRKLVIHFADHAPSVISRDEAESFFGSMWFAETDDEYVQWRITKKTILQNPIFKTGQPRPANVRKITELPAYMRTSAVKELTTKQHSITAVTPPDIHKAFDPGISCAVLQEGEPVGILLLKKTGSTIYPISVYATRPAHAKQMFLFAKSVLFEEEKTGFTLCIDTDEPRAIKLSEQVFGTTGSRVTGRVWR